MNDRKYVIFLDSLGTDDIDHMEWCQRNLAVTGSMDAGPVYVTPTVLGSIYTGKSPSDHGLPSVSRYDGDPRGRPDGLTIPEIAAETDQYDTVVQMGLPFIAPPVVQGGEDGEYYHHSGAFGQAATFPQDVEAQITTPTAPGELDKPDENFDLAFDARIDHAHEAFGRMRNFSIQSDADVVFFGYRVLDAYCHYQYDEDYRDLLLEEVDRQIQYTANLGDVFVFGDHGATHLDAVFRLNRWLIDNGYLDVEIDHEWIEKAKEYGTIEDDESTPGETLGADSPGVTVNEESSVAIGDDPFSTGITLLDGADESSVTELVADLESLDGIEATHWTTELWPDGDHADECPDLYAERVPGVFVSGNLHPDPGGAEITRSGVHHPYGLYGSTADLPLDASTDPQGLFHVIAEDFLELDVEDATESETGDTDVDMDDTGVRDHLEDLGYL